MILRKTPASNVISSAVGASVELLPLSDVVAIVGISSMVGVEVACWVNVMLATPVLLVGIVVLNSPVFVWSGEIAMLGAPVFVGLGDIIASLLVLAGPGDSIVLVGSTDVMVLVGPDDVIVLVGLDDIIKPPVLVGPDDVIALPILVGPDNVITPPVLDDVIDDVITPPVLVGPDDVIAPSSPDDVITPPALPIIVSSGFAVLRASESVLIGPVTVVVPSLVLVGSGEVVLVSVFSCKHVSSHSPQWCPPPISTGHETNCLTTVLVS